MDAMHPYPAYLFFLFAQGYDWLWQTVGPIPLHVGIYGLGIVAWWWAGTEQRETKRKVRALVCRSDSDVALAQRATSRIVKL